MVTRRRATKESPIGAQHDSPRRKPWENERGEIQAPAGRHTVLSQCRMARSCAVADEKCAAPKGLTQFNADLTHGSRRGLACAAALRLPLSIEARRHEGKPRRGAP